MFRLPPVSRIVFWAFTLVLLAWSIRAPWDDSESALLPALAIGGYVAFVVAGVVFPSLRMHADTVLSCTGPAVVLTFDDGPNPSTTRHVLALLREHAQTATFFVIGRKVAEHPEVVREIVEAGHEVALHSYDHDRLYVFKHPRDVVLDIRRTQLAVREACGQTPRLFRPPVGMASPRTAEGARRAGVAMIGWSVRGIDGLPRSCPQAVLRRLQRGLRPGAILLLHDAAERDDFIPASLEVLPRLLEEIRARGLATRRLSDMLSCETSAEALASTAAPTVGAIESV